MPTGSAKSAVGSGPSVIPADCRPHVTRIVTMAPKAIVSPWAKLENRRMP
jgi:hypothetical protein